MSIPPPEADDPDGRGAVLVAFLDPAQFRLLGAWLGLYLLGQALGCVEGALAAFFRYRHRQESDAGADQRERHASRVRAYALYTRLIFLACVAAVFAPLAGGGGALSGRALAVAGLLIVSWPIAYHAGRAHSPRVLGAALPALGFVYVLFWPLSKALDALARLGAPRGTGEEEEERRKEDFLEATMSLAQEGGLLAEESLDMLESLVEFKDVQVREVMTPRTDIVCLELSTPISEAVRVAQQAGHSRIPVYRESRDDVVGMFYVKDLLTLWDRRDEAMTIADVARPDPFFIPETKMVSHLLGEFRQRKLHIAVVLDEYGGTAGIVTNEDIIEEIVGEIQDEWDPDLAQPYQRMAPGETAVDARMPIDELNELLRIDLPDDEYETIGGFVFNQLGHIPKVGEALAVSVEGRGEPGLEDAAIHITVAGATERRITRLHLRHPPVDGDIGAGSASGNGAGETPRVRRNAQLRRG